ncbi:MAG: Hydrogenase isoenzymes formation protein HypE [candidate division WS2 bacterium]|nr:Hydrogenase isoenzymes formation protein HypE [Candidatus Lithacetigena glycinireducens]
MNKDEITLSHGAGGEMSHQLIEHIFLPKLYNPILSELKDSGVFRLGKNNLAFTTDSFVVSPIFFPGGDIGKLAICGTVNDLSVVGAKPLYISLSLIIEEGLDIVDLQRIISSVQKTASVAGVKIITGDTKVVERGSCDKIFINTAGIGIIEKPLSEKIKPADKIIISGTLADHYIAILSQREKMDTNIKSDCACLNHLCEEIVRAGRISWMRDPTRGGVATSLCELAKMHKVGIKIYEDKIPVKKEVRALCEIMGFDVLYLANEGKLLAVVNKNDCDKVLRTMRKNKLGKEAQVIGEITSSPPARVLMETITGGVRIVDKLSGEQLPRIC